MRSLHDYNLFFVSDLRLECEKLLVKCGSNKPRRVEIVNLVVNASSMQYLWGKFTDLDLEDDEIDNELTITEGLREILSAPEIVA